MNAAQRIARTTPTPASPGMRWVPVTIMAVDAGPPATVTVTVGADGVPIPGVPYMASYTPTADDQAWALRDGPGRLIVIGTLA